jgi:hypothetical protein
MDRQESCRDAFWVVCGFERCECLRAAPSNTRTAASHPTLIPIAGNSRAEALPAGSRTTLRTCSTSRTVRRR